MEKNNLENLSDQEKLDFIKESRILDESFLEADFELRDAFFFQDNRILLCFSFGLWSESQETIHIGSCSSSMVDFWSGIGIFEKRKDTFVTRIISRKQYGIIKENLEKVYPDNNSLKKIGKNYNEIYVYDGKLNF